jgi:hypothetical protein
MSEIEYTFNHVDEFAPQVNTQMSSRNSSISEELLADMNRVFENLRAIRRAHPNIGVLNSFATDPVTGTQVKVVLA